MLSLQPLGGVRGYCQRAINELAETPNPGLNSQIASVAVSALVGITMRYI